jgi:hypothetical protein
LLLTLFSAVTSTASQVYEYIEASFSISDGIYGSTLFMATGFHGYHDCPAKLISFPMGFVRVRRTPKQSAPYVSKDRFADGYQEAKICRHDRGCLSQAIRRVIDDNPNRLPF